MKFSEGDGGAKRRVRLHRARDSAEFEKITSGCATQGLWLGDRKVGSQVNGRDQSRFHGRNGEERKKSQRQNKGEKVHRFRVRFGR